MDLRYHEGGDELSSTWAPVIGTITAKMEFIALDAEMCRKYNQNHTIVHWGRLLTSIYILGCNNTRRGWKYVTIGYLRS